jgi:hypothetical protein
LRKEAEFYKERARREMENLTHNKSELDKLLAKEKIIQ